MEEINAVHEVSLEWGCIANLIDRIADIEEEMDGHWDELLDMVADIVDKEGQEKDPTKIFFDIYSFFFRLYHRLRNNPTKRDFNKITSFESNGKRFFRISNYDYNTFKWARGAGFADMISNDCIDMPEDKLTTNQKRAFERRIGD